MIEQSPVTRRGGDVTGPASAVDGHIPQFDGTTGKKIKDGLTLDADGALAANSDSRIASQKAVKTYVDGAITAIPPNQIIGLAYFNGDATSLFHSGIIGSVDPDPFIVGRYSIPFSVDLGDTFYGVHVTPAPRDLDVGHGPLIGSPIAADFLGAGFSIQISLWNPGVLGLVDPSWDNFSPLWCTVTVYRIP